MTNYTTDIDTRTDTHMDETEDEEVKRNCFGMKHYESSSDEESCSEESGEFSSPIKFSSGKPPLGIGILRPTPMTLQRVLQKRLVDPIKHPQQIIRNECEFSDDEQDSRHDDQSCESSVNHATFPKINKDDCEIADDDSSASEATEDISDEDEEDVAEESSVLDELLSARKEFLLKMMYPQFQMMPLLALMQATNHLTKRNQRTTKKMIQTFELS